MSDTLHPVILCGGSGSRLWPMSRKLAPKWRRALVMVEWVTAQLPANSQFQVYGFNTKSRALIGDSHGKWLDSNDPRAINNVLSAARNVVPGDGTSLVNAFITLRTINPQPDQIILITDGLPTQGDKPPLVRTLVTAEQREDLMQDAVKSLPPSPPPFNIVLLPMEGDPSAPIFFWRLARSTNGGFLSPARDWP